MFSTMYLVNKDYQKVLTEGLCKRHVGRTALRVAVSGRYVRPAAVTVPRHLAPVAGIVLLL